VPKGEYLQYGGQAVVEGVMMRSPKYFSVACRAPNGDIVIQTEHLEKTWLGRQKWLKWPFLRGSLALVDSMALGAKALRFAATVQSDPIYYPPGVTPEEVRLHHTRPVEGTKSDIVAPAPPSGNAKIQDIAIIGTVIVSLVLGFAIFNVLPNSVAEFIGRKTHNQHGRELNYISESVKATLFIGYIWAIGQFKDVAEVFKYHGAEHKAINTLEHDRPLVIEECVLQTRLHPRCGTSFAFIVFFLGFLFLPLVPRYPVTGHQGNAVADVSVRILMELCLLPLIAGTAYELIRLAGKFRSKAIVNAVFQPGMWSQYLTTREPDHGQIEVALAALKACIDAENADQATEPDANLIESAPPLPTAGLG
jgi:uncharacterized protein YqhQ